MIKEAHLEFVRTKGSKLGRVLMGLLFFAAGLSMLLIQGPTETAVYFASLGIPLAMLAVWIVIIVKVVAGGAVILGRQVPLAAAVLIVFTLLATAIAHMNIADVNLFKNLAIVGGLLYLMAFGPGGVDVVKDATPTPVAEPAPQTTMGI